MMKKSTLLHLRIPFSFFLLPVFLFAAALSTPVNWERFGFIFFILHFLLYPASNGYNSYFDKDEGSIGGLKTPPKVSKELYYVALLLDLLAIGLGWTISWEFALMLLIYGMVSKAYSHPLVRLKKLPITGWLAAGVFQGYFTWIMVYMALNDAGFNELSETKIHFAALLSTLLLFGSYPMTQIYQHAEDKKRGDNTLSVKLGILGTFHFTTIFFMVSVLLLAGFFNRYFSIHEAVIFLVSLLPVLVYFGWWYLEVRKDPDNADFTRTMRLNMLSSTCLNLFFFWLLIS